MTSWNPQANELFLKALDLPGAEERRLFLDEVCLGDPALRAEVEAMLDANARAGQFLEQGAANPDATAAQPASARPGTMIGPYKLLEQIGEGGFGVVYMAEQTEPVRRKVALKILKAGMDTKQVIARFEAERQALAIMDHPNIAKVFDGGMTGVRSQESGVRSQVSGDAARTPGSCLLTPDAGRPYFVMELVKGVPITEFCDEQKLSPRQRLELFLPVCQAVQHAHQKGIIHRDLKPSNVLVSRHDSTAVPKIIDFGIAKALGQELTDKTLFTGIAQMVGTPLYMSPEQAGMSDLDIDTRSDIYSLGVLLYELLTGTTPFDKERFKQAAYDEIRRIIREEDPPKPSTRLSDSKDSLPSISAQRQTEPAKLTKLVRGELDWIVMKALEKDRNRRYETANGFAMDLQRYLVDEPVQACAPSAGYRLRKFVRRNRSSIAVAGVVLFFLVLLGSGIGWAVRDRAARDAEQASNLEHAVERAELLHREGKRGEASAALERAQLLAREAEPAPPMAERMASLQQLLDAEERDTVFVARFEAIRREVHTEVDVAKNAFRWKEAYPKWREALENYGIEVGVTPPADVVTRIQKRPAAIKTILIAALDECFYRESRSDSGNREWLIEVLRQADSDPWRNRVRRAWKEPATLDALAKDIDVRQQPPSFLLLVVGAWPIESPNRLDLNYHVQFAYPGDFWANHQLGLNLAEAGKHAEAIRYYTAALSLRPDNPGVLLNRAHALHDVRELEAAIVDLRRAIAVAPRYSNAYNSLGLVLQDQKKLDQAIDAFRKAIDLDPPDAFPYRNLGLALRDQKKLNEAVDAFRMAIKIDPRFGSAYHDLGVTLCEQKKLDEGIDAFRRAADINPKSATAYHDLGRALHELKKVNEAIDAYRKAIELDSTYASAYTGLGNALFDQKKLDAAIVAFRNAIKINPQYALAYHNLGLALGDQKKLDEAVVAFKTAIKIDPQLAIACYSLGRALLNQKKLDEAIDAFHKAADVNPKYAAAYVGLGVALRNQKKLDEAEKALRKAVELDPKDALAFGGLGATLAMQKKWPEAGAAFQKEVELDPTNANAYRNLGVALCHQKKLDEGIAAFRKAIDLNPKLAFARQDLSNALWQDGWAQMCSPDPKRRDPKRAIERVKEAIELVPQSEMAWQCLGWVQYRLGEWRASVEALEKSCKLQQGCTGDAGQWIVLALAHARLAAQDGLPEKEREHHKAEARRRYEEADKQIDGWWRARPGHETGQAIWDFRAEARELLPAKESKK